MVPLQMFVSLCLFLREFLLFPPERDNDLPIRTSLVLRPSLRTPVDEGYNSRQPNETSLASSSDFSMEGMVPLLAGFRRYGLAPA
jgi:hypothetical protein